MTFVQNSQFDMFSKLFAICMTCVIIGSSLEKDVFDEIEEEGGNITSDGMKKIVLSYPKIALHLLQMMNEAAKKDEEIVKSDEEIKKDKEIAKNNFQDAKRENGLLEYQKTMLENEYKRALQELELSRVICTFHFLGNVYKDVAVWWRSGSDSSRKADYFYFDPNYHKCFQYLNYSGTPNVSGDVMSRLNDETIPAVNKARKESSKAMNNLDDDQEKNRKTFCDMIEKKGHSIHDFCWVYWKGCQIGGAMQYKINKVFDSKMKFKMFKSDPVCPQFKTGQLMYADEDASIINLMLELNQLSCRISIKNGSPNVDQC